MKKKETKEKEMEFLKQLSMPSSVWHSKGIKVASETKSNQISGNNVLSFAGINIQDFEKASDHQIDPLVRDHVFVECQYQHYIEQQQKSADILLKEQVWDKLDL
jgi:tRNA U34 5-carboxymethylaminomethyl modifying enzyme MnmG/GidA